MMPLWAIVALVNLSVAFLFLIGFLDELDGEPKSLRQLVTLRLLYLFVIATVGLLIVAVVVVTREVERYRIRQGIKARKAARDAAANVGGGK